MAAPSMDPLSVQGPTPAPGVGANSLGVPDIGSIVKGYINTGIPILGGPTSDVVKVTGQDTVGIWT